jgi:hypothetical protein
MGGSPADGWPPKYEYFEMRKYAEKYCKICIVNCCLLNDDVCFSTF